MILKPIVFFFLCTLSFSHELLATHLLIKKAHLFFEHTQGEGSTELVRIDEKIYPQLKFSIHRQGNQFQIQYNHDHFNFKLSKKGDYDFDYLEMDNFNFELKSSHFFSLNVDKFAFQRGDKFQQIEQLEITCGQNETHFNKTNIGGNDLLLYLPACLSQGFFSLSSLDNLQKTQEKSRGSIEFLLDILVKSISLPPNANGDHHDGTETIQGFKKIKNFKIHIDQNQYLLSLKVDSTPKAKVAGEIYYLKSLNQIQIVIKKAKVLIIPIKKRILKFVEEANLSNIKVKEDTIFIDL